MRPYEGLVFSLGKYQYKIKQITDTEVVSVRLDSDGSETSKIKNFLLTQWPPDGASFDKKGGEKDKKKSSSKDEEQIKDMPPHQETDLGEAPDYPSIFFVYNYETKKLEVRDRRNNIKQEIPIITIDGINGKSAYDIWLEQHGPGSTDTFINSLKGQNGKNGKNAYEEWKEWRGTGADTSEEAYWDYFKGQNGKSAFELWKAVHGEKENSTPDDFFEYLKGQDGKDAYEVWQELGYKNGTRQDFFKWIASLVETQKGEDGKIYYPHFDGFTLYFTEDLEGNGPRLTEQDIRGKDGRTFTPKFDGTKLYFDDGENPPTEPVELRGKDAFELWKEYHHKPDAKYEEFEEYFKGQNVQADHSYLDIKDFTCPIQTIDTDLIANVLDSGTSPDNLVKLRQEDIDRLRQEGNKRNDITFFGYKVPYFFLNGSYIYKHWAGWFKEFSWWCAGADRGLLRMCPGDHSKYTGIGTVILFTAIMAFFSSSFALSYVFKPEMQSDNFSTIGIIAGSVWAAMIFFLDRFITNTMYSDGKVTISWEEFCGGLPRILIAIFLGIVISAPLELKIFNDEINDLLKEDIINTNQVQVTKDPLYVTMLEKVNVAKEEYNLQKKAAQKFLNKSNADSTYYDKEQLISGSSTSKTPSKSSDGKGGTMPTTTTISSTSYTYNSKFNENRWNEDKAKQEEISKQSQTVYLSKLDSLENLKKQLNEQYCSDAIINTAVFNKGLNDRLSKLHHIAMKDYVSWDWCGETLDTIIHTWWWYLFNSAVGLIMLLFILIDISPVLYKMMLADGVYDNYLHQEKLLAQDKIRLSLARMLRNIEKGELKSLSPFIMGKIYRKLMKYSYSSDGKYKGEDKDYKNHIKWENAGGLNDDIKKVNKEVFDIVLDYKKRIILASYSAWYRDMRDAMIGKKDDVEGSKITPESHLNNDDRAKKEEEQLNNTEKDNSSDDVNNLDKDDSTSNEDNHNED